MRILLDRLREDPSLLSFRAKRRISHCPLKINCAKNLALSIFMNIRDSSSPAAQNESANEFFRSLSSRTTPHLGGGNPSVPQIPD